MSEIRKLPEWIGAKPGTPLPDRVKLRIMDRQHDRCDGCTRELGGRLKPEFDHRPPLILGGQNRESMIVAVCHECHAERTREDVAAKSKLANIRKRDRGIRTTGRPMPGSRASGWKKRLDGSVVRRT